MPVECAITERPFTIADLPDLLPAVLEPVYEQVLPAVLGGDPVTLPAQMPTGLPATAAAELAAALTPQRPSRTSRSTPTVASGPVTAGTTMVIDEAGRWASWPRSETAEPCADAGTPLPYLLAWR